MSNPISGIEPIVLDWLREISDEYAVPKLITFNNASHLGQY